MRIVSFAVCLAVVPAATATAAAPIAWQGPVDATGSASDFLTAGSLFDSATAGVGVTVGGVTFRGKLPDTGAGDLHFAGSGITVTGARSTFTSIYSAPVFGDAAYDTLVGGAAIFDTPFAGVAIELTGLTVGRRYAVQLFQPFWNRNWATNYSAGATSGNVNATGPDVGAGTSSVPQYLIGTFRATAGTQTITPSSPTAIVLFDAMQVRELTPADEAEAADHQAPRGGFGLVGAALRRRQVTIPLETI